MNFVKHIPFLFIAFVQIVCTSPNRIANDNKLLGTWYATERSQATNTTYETLKIDNGIFTRAFTGYLAELNRVDTERTAGTWIQLNDTLYVVYTGTTDTFHLHFQLYTNGNSAEDELGLFGYIYNRM
jgi:hypothetical protein